MDPSWHHNYASLGWFDLKSADHTPHYPATRPDLVPLITALHAIAHQPDDRAAWFADAPAFADRFTLSPEQREALIKLDVPGIVAMGAHTRWCRSWRTCRWTACAVRRSRRYEPGRPTGCRPCAGRLLTWAGPRIGQECRR